MRNVQPTRKKKPIMLAIGILILALACLSCSGSVLLDVVGAKAIGEVSDVSVGCPAGKTCWTGKVVFTTSEGEQVSFYPMTFPMLFDFDPLLSGRSYEAYGEYQVRYFEIFPKLAKIKLAFFLEYINILCGLGLGGFLTLFGFLSSRDDSHRPLVLDLSKWKKK